MNNENISQDWRIAAPPAPDSDIVRSYTADVIVIGLGHAGTPAVRAAAESGASVIGIEIMEEDKYDAWGNDVGHINSKFLADKGVPHVDPIDLFNEWMRRSGNRANPKLVMQFCQKCGDAFDWFIQPFKPEQLAEMRIAFWPPAKHFTGEVAGQKFWVGTAQFPGFSFKGDFRLSKAVVVNQNHARKVGALLHFGMDAQQLIKTGERITGVIVKDNKGQYVKYNATKGVILATGDFGSNKEMCRELLEDISDLFQEGEEFRSGGRDGRGIQMGVWAGGRLEARPLATMGGNFCNTAGILGSFGSLCVDATGKRFCNESIGDPVFAGFPKAQGKRGILTKIFDSNIFEQLQYANPTHMGFRVNDAEAETRLRESMAGAIAAGPGGHPLGRGSKLYAANSFEELADFTGFKDSAKQNLLNTIKRYNEFCKNGRDEEFGKDSRLLFPIDTPPYYAQPGPGMGIGMMMVTCGGLLTDEYQNVLNQQMDPIPGLYATGNCCGRRFGPQYSTPIAGVSIGIAMTLGREVGKIVAGL